MCFFCIPHLEIGRVIYWFNTFSAIDINAAMRTWSLDWALKLWNFSDQTFSGVEGSVSVLTQEAAGEAHRGLHPQGSASEISLSVPLSLSPSLPLYRHVSPPHTPHSLSFFLWLKSCLSCRPYYAIMSAVPVELSNPPPSHRSSYHKTMLGQGYALGSIVWSAELRSITERGDAGVVRIL